MFFLEIKYLPADVYSKKLKGDTISCLWHNNLLRIIFFCKKKIQRYVLLLFRALANNKDNSFFRYVFQDSSVDSRACSSWHGNSQASQSPNGPPTRAMRRMVWGKKDIPARYNWPNTPLMVEVSDEKLKWPLNRSSSLYRGSICGATWVWKSSKSFARFRVMHRTVPGAKSSKYSTTRRAHR